MKTSTIEATDGEPIQRLVANPQLDQPDGEVTWQRWLEGRQRLETALLFSGA